MKEDLKAYWARVRKIEVELKQTHPNGIHLSTLASDNGMPAGLIKQALPFLAAVCLANRSHEIATPEQIEAWNQKQETERRHIEARRRWASGAPDVFVVAGGSR